MIFDPIIGGVLLVGFTALLWAAMGHLNWRRFLRRKAFGSAQWAGPWMLRRAGLTKTGGLFLGRSRGRDLYHNGEGHLLTIGGAGGGKSSGLVVPALLELTEGSVIVTDPSGELAAMTMRHRADGGRVALLNPFQTIFEQGTGLNYPDTGFNPLSVLDPAASTFKTDCDALARYLMVTDRQSSESYWNDEGKTFLSLMIASIILYEDSELHTLSFLYIVVRDRPEMLAKRLEHIIKQGNPALQYEAEGFLGIIKHAPQQWQGAVRKAATATARYAPSTPLGEHTAKNGFDVADLKRENMTVYLLVPSSQLATALPWMNTLMGVFGMAVGRPGPARPVTMLIDEAPSLGYLPDLIPFMAQYRKAGLRVWLFTQTAAHLAGEELYGQSGFRTIMGLCATKQYFAISEPEIAQAISDQCGQKTADNVSANTGGAAVADVGVPLIRPERIRGLKKWHQIIIREGLDSPIRAKLIPYFSRASWLSKTDPNPYRKN